MALYALKVPLSTDFIANNISCFHLQSKILFRSILIKYCNNIKKLPLGIKLSRIYVIKLLGSEKQII